MLRGKRTSDRTRTRASVTSVRTALLVLAAAAAVVILPGCADDDTVYTRPPGDDLTGAKGFLGYSNVEAKATVCGNCHVGQQTRWETSGHADAWDGLQASGHAQSFCEGCHVTGALGNPTTGEVGFAAAPEERYHDVQCEACHGPGQNHVLNPDVEPNQPVPSIAVDAGLTCGECHTGAHHPFVDEWARSRHAALNASIKDRIATNPSYLSCLSCHSAQGVLAAWGVSSDYAEKNDAPQDQLGIVCVVCHDPHGSANSAQLRFPIDVVDVEVNLCMRCHHKRGEPEIDAATLRGPHSPEGPVLLGQAGWIPPGQDVGDLRHAHGSAQNPRLCASCHVDSYEVTDSASGEFLITATGHLFAAVPCVDENGVPTEDSECEPDERTFRSCAQAGCHFSESDGRDLYLSFRTAVAERVADLDALLELVPDGELNQSDGRFTVADGAWFNARLGAFPGTAIHNPRLSLRLLEASMNAVEEEYGISAPRRASLE